ncbi:MAG: polysaccharide biosynthesis tyrosine autokinase [Terrimonas sp.]|nr:polysaccharide biosynthesis tyrosine autokinase [Terrimonas sp.]
MSDSFETGFEGNANRKEFQLKEFIFKYLRYWPLLLAFIIIALTIAFVIIRYSTPVYSVSGALFINKQPANNSAGADLQNMFMFPDNVNLKNELEILKSKPLLKRVAQNLGLQFNYLNKGNVRSSNIYRESPVELEIISLKDASGGFSLDIEATEENFRFTDTKAILLYNAEFQTKAGTFRLHKVPGKSFRGFNSSNYIIQYRPLSLSASILASQIKTAQNIEQATILNITIETDNPAYGKDVLNELMKEYGKMNIEEKREISQVTMQFIDERLDTIKNELGGVETGLLRFREKNEVIDLTTQSQQYYQNYSELNQQFNAQHVQMGVLDYLIRYINEAGNEHKLVPTDLGIQEPVLLPLLGQYNTLQLQRNTLEQTTGPANAALVNIDVSLSKLREQIAEALKNVKKSYTIATDKMQEQISRVQSSLKAVPSKAKGLLDIERQQKIKQDLYLFLLQKREEAAIAAAATVASSYPLEEAASSGNPVKPNKKNIYLVALLVGILIPVAIIAIMEMLNDKVTEREQVVKYTSVPIVGEIGHAGDENTLVVLAGARTIVAEQFRIMRTNVQYLVSKVQKPVMLVTSSVSGEGKSFIATNYGAAIALTGKKTVVLEFDIRKPRLLKGLGMQSAKGLSNFIIGNITDVNEIIHPVQDFPGLHVIGCGPIPPNPSELLLDSNVKLLFEKLKEQFDYIIIDSAPVGLVSDAFTLSSSADACLYIVRQGYTLRRQLSMVEDLYAKKRLSNMGLVVNDIHAQGRYKGYYGDGVGME